MNKMMEKYYLRPYSAHLFGRIRPAAVLLLLLILPAGSLSAGDDLTLDRALNIAFQKSPAMRQVSLQLEVNEQNLMAQQAGLKSQFSLTLMPYRTSSDRVFSDLTSDYNTQTQTRSEATFNIRQPIAWTDGTLNVTNRFNWQEASSSFAGGGTQSGFSNSLTVSLNQPLFTYNRTKLALKELELALENTQLAYAIQKLQIERAVTQQFLNLYYSRMSIQISNEEYKNASESLDIIQNKVDAGITAPEELYQADITRDNSLASLENNRMQHQNSLDTFKILLGLELEDLIDVSADIQKKMVEVDLDIAVAHGLDNRLELRQKDIEIQNAMHDLIVASAENEFKASLNLSFGLTGTNPQFAGIYDSPNSDRLVALTLNIPLFDWGEKKHHLAATRAQIETVKLSAEEETKSIKQEIREAYRNLMNQERQIEIAEKSIKNAELTYAINLERYRNGDLSSKDLQFYQLQLSQQKLARVQSLINYKLALLDLKIRTLWDFENNRSILDDLEVKLDQED
ncbi:MAG: TolC family protein [Candidatus Aminicenantes bacterium]|nr:TolC family protein [Candidatus Aminicenantes bacterium]